MDSGLARLDCVVPRHNRFSPHDLPPSTPALTTNTHCAPRIFNSVSANNLPTLPTHSVAYDFTTSNPYLAQRSLCPVTPPLLSLLCQFDLLTLSKLFPKQTKPCLLQLPNYARKNTLPASTQRPTPATYLAFSCNVNPLPCQQQALASISLLLPLASHPKTLASHMLETTIFLPPNYPNTLPNTLLRPPPTSSEALPANAQAFLDTRTLASLCHPVRISPPNTFKTLSKRYQTLPFASLKLCLKNASHTPCKLPLHISFPALEHSHFNQRHRLAHFFLVPSQAQSQSQ